jgi:hypothetical protein
MTVERFITPRGFVFKSDKIDSVVKVNWCMFFRQRKIDLYDGEVIKYSLRQENYLEYIFHAILYAILWDDYKGLCPASNLYLYGEKIGQTYKPEWEDFQVKIDINSETYRLRPDSDEEYNYVIMYDNQHNPIVTFRVKRIREYKKNIWEIIAEENFEVPDSDLLLMLCGFSDLGFFTESDLFTRCGSLESR